MYGTRALTIDAAMRLVGRKIQILLPGNADWQRAIISECKIEWVEGGLKAEPWHQITVVDESERRKKSAGAPTWQELTKRRWYERRAAPISEKDREAEARWQATKARRDADEVGGEVRGGLGVRRTAATASILFLFNTIFL